MQKHELPLEELLFNLDILQHLGYENWMTINPVLQGEGWLITPKNWFEVAVGRRKRKTMMNEFLNNEVLFDLYVKKQIQTNYQHNEGHIDVLIYQMETGSTKYECLNPHVDLDRISYEMAPQLLSQKLCMGWVENICYNNGALSVIMNDKLVTSSSAILISPKI